MKSNCDLFSQAYLPSHCTNQFSILVKDYMEINLLTSFITLLTYFSSECITLVLYTWIKIYLTSIKFNYWYVKLVA